MNRTGPPTAPAARRPLSLRRPPTGQLAFLLLLAGLLIAHVISVFTENINWDEFALLARAADTLATGQLRSGGRPGLATLILVPFVQGCVDSIEVIRNSRLLWVAFTVALVAGFWILLTNVGGERHRRFDRAALGVALLVLVPAFLRFSLQVRSDQPAIALGLWGGVALLWSRRSAGWALLAGAYFGAGWLFSQKLVYVAALTGLLAAGDLLLRQELQIRREGLRLVLCAVGGLAVLLGYRFLLPTYFEPAALETLSGGLNTFAHYRADFGFGFYGLMLPTLIPHFVLLALLTNATVRAIRKPDAVAGATREHERADWRTLLLAWAVLALGVAVLLFHAAALPYFWMTLGLFPAAAIAIGFEPIRNFFPRERERRILVGSLWTILVIQASVTAAVLLKDTQRVQRDSLAFIARNFDPDQQGFHPERALFCRDKDDPLPSVSAAIVLKSRYWGPERGRQSAELLREFRERPVYFLLDSFRLGQFPPEITAFWRTNYRPYYESVWLPAKAVDGPAGARRQLHIFVPGAYRLEVPGDAPGPAVRLDGRPVQPGESVELDAGVHEVELLREIDGGALGLVVDDSPRPATQDFYKPLEVIGLRW